MCASTTCFVHPKMVRKASMWRESSHLVTSRAQYRSIHTKTAVLLPYAAAHISLAHHPPVAWKVLWLERPWMSEISIIHVQRGRLITFARNDLRFQGLGDDSLFVVS